ncbi:hypothetical protein GCM10015535_02650 [Streptomyces gelaticus]|uniref:Uncharacterized protein n=1 Tax=Streptomyces gelaticus TaxID=285446 RepID=A0ABQ2VRD5_9ACTN|nr:hypothetical protein [Streptomyces gelaticus]GGV74222.1 hypothetical protein GCM10015535_02650 [Streptomyces gelaticus]
MVTYSGHGNGVQISSIVPGAGREGMGFTRFRADGHEHAVPVDVLGRISGGRVDQRPFDVTARRLGLHGRRDGTRCASFAERDADRCLQLGLSRHPVPATRAGAEGAG